MTLNDFGIALLMFLLVIIITMVRIGGISFVINKRVFEKLQKLYSNQLNWIGKILLAFPILFITIGYGDSWLFGLVFTFLFIREVMDK